MPEKPVRLGVLVPMTGLAALYGREIARAARIAAESVNARRGVLGRSLELVIGDDGSLPDTAVPAARRLIEDQGCVALVGTLLSNARLAVCENVTEPQRVPLLNFSFYEGSIFSRWFFNFAALPNQQIDRMIPYMAERFGPKMYFAGNNYEWPRGSIHAAMASLAAAGGEVLAEEYLPLDPHPDLVADLIARVAQSGADVFVPYFAGSDQVSVLTEFAAAGLKDRMQVVMGHFDAAMAGQLAPSVRDGLFASNSYFMSVPTKQNADLLAALARQPDVTGVWPRGDGVVTNFGEGAYMCVLAFAAAIESAGSLDVRELCAALESVKVDSAQGMVVMDPVTHHAAVNAYLAQCDAQGDFRIVRSFGSAPPVVPARYRSLFPGTVAPAPGSPEPAETPAAEPGELAAGAFGATSAAMFVADEQGLLLAANPAAADLLGFRTAELIGHSVFTLFPPSDRLRRRRAFQQLISGAGPVLRETMPGYRSDGSYVPLDVQVTRMDLQGRPLIVMTARDVADWEARQAELRWLATHDELTGLANRSLITDRLTRSLARAAQGDSHVGVLYIDLDGFKFINDGHGHATGDRLLEAVGRQLAGAVRPGDTVARLAGDEFLVVAEKVSGAPELVELAETVAEAMRAPVHVEQLALTISASIGIAVSDADTVRAQDLMSCADLAMYAAKSEAPGRYRLFDPALHAAHQRQLMLKEDLRGALDRGEFECYFQPVVLLRDGAVTGMEALLRWHSPHGEIPPAEFIPLSEASGAIDVIGDWVLAQACAAEVTWRSTNPASAPWISVNVSPWQLMAGDFAARFTSIVHLAGARADRLVIEITETALMESLDRIADVLRQLTETGVRVAVDDFGTGYSSLQALAALPVAVLKIDRFFIAAASEDPRSADLLGSIARIGHTMDLTMIAEGIETADQRDLLLRCGCEVGQGFWFSRPIPFTDIDPQRRLPAC